MTARLSLIAALLLSTATAAGAAALRIGLENDPDTLDPDRSRLFVGRIVFTALCDKLVDVNEKLEIVPQLATDWTQAEDGRSITFTLREGVKFHDGTAFDAEAVKANIERSKTLEDSVRKSELASVESVDVISPTEVRLNLSAPDSTVIAQLSDRAGMMMSPAAFAEGKDFSSAPACSGPFKFVSRVAQDRITLAAHMKGVDHFGGKDGPGQARGRPGRLAPAGRGRARPMSTASTTEMPVMMSRSSESCQ